MLTDEKSGQKILRSIFNPAHHFVRLCLGILAVRMALVRKRCGGKFGWLVLVDSLPKLIFGTSRYVKYSIVPSQLTCCAQKHLKVLHSRNTIPSQCRPPPPDNNDTQQADKHKRAHYQIMFPFMLISCPTCCVSCLSV